MFRAGIRPKLFAFAAALTVLAGCAQTGAGTTTRIAGPYDPGQNLIPASDDVTALCGKKVARALYTLSDRYVDVATEWERYQVYAEETETDGTTAEELDGLDKRHRNITTALRRYRSAAKSLRSAAAKVEGLPAADCDRSVIAPYENEYAAREERIELVETESLRILTERGGEE